MAEEAEGEEIGTEAAAGGFDPAIALALGGASREEANAFLKKQGHLVDLQAKELAHELKLRHWSLRVRHVSGLLKLAFEVSLALIGVAAAVFIGAVVWNAAHADGLIIDAFSVPSDLAAQGLTGEVVANRMLSRLTDLQAETASARAPRSFANDWGDDIKVEIPDTGVSFGEAYRYLKDWLGHETHVSGEVVRTDTGITLTAYVSSGGSSTYAGTETDLGSLIEKVVENIYSRTQPYRYGVYLDSHGRTNEALAIYRQLAMAGPEQERPWGYVGLGNLFREIGTPQTAKSMHERALALQPDNMLVLTDLQADELAQSHPLQALQDAQKILSAGRNDQSLVTAASIITEERHSKAIEDGLAGDFQKAAREFGEAGPSNGNLRFYVPLYQTDDHDLATARRAFVQRRAQVANTALYGGEFNSLLDIAAQMRIDSEAQDWTSLVSRASGLAPLFQKFASLRSWSLTMTVPFTAYANAKLGNIATAEAEITQTPADCYDCLIARARIAEVEGQHARADWWFDRAVKSNPSIPFAYAEWGVALLDRGDPDGAIAKFKLANQKGPHFADPLEMWGEALMAKNRSDQALAKFSEAEKYAPNWGRLHLKWGEALGYVGRKDNAQKQFALAAGLDLSSADKAELAKASHG